MPPANTKRKASNGRREQEQVELNAHTEQVAALEGELASLRERLSSKTEERDALQADLRQRERNIEEARNGVLRLVGEASTLRNQVVQIDEYLAAIERDTARTRRDEDAAVQDLSRLDKIKSEISRKLSAQQMELESLADRRTRVDQELQERRLQIQSSRAQLEEIRTVLSRQKARRDSLDEILSHRAYTTESVKRLFTAIEQGQAGTLKPMGVLADFVELTDSTWKKRRKRSCMRNWNTSSFMIGAKPNRALASCAPKPMAARPSWFTAA